MAPEIVLNKKDIVHSVTTAFLPRSVLIPLCQENKVFCNPVVKEGDSVEEGQVVAEDSAGTTDSAKIHSPIPGYVTGVKKCAYPNGKYGEAVEIRLAGKFSHIGKNQHSFDWKSWGSSSLLNRISALGVINTFSMREGHSLCAEIKELKDFSSARVFVRLYDEDLSCQTDFVLARSQFEKILKGVDIISEIIQPREIVFAYAKNDRDMQMKLSALSHDETLAANRALLPVSVKKYPFATKSDIVLRYRKFFKISESEKSVIDNSLFIDAETLSILADTLVFNVPVERVNVYVSGDCLKSSAVLKVCVGTSFRSIAQQLGIEPRRIGKIVVNGFINGFSVSSMDTPVTKYIKSIAFISRGDIADYATALCLGCGKCRASCPAHIYPDIIYGHLINSIKVPQSFIRSSLLCIECGVCNTVCPTKLPLSQVIKLLKEKQNAAK